MSLKATRSRSITFLISDNLFNNVPFEFDVVHVNAEFADQASDHDPQVVRLSISPPDTTAPTVTINQAAGQADPTGSQPDHLRLSVFSEPVTGFDDAADVDLERQHGATTAVVADITPIDAQNYTVSVSGMTGNGTVIASIPANAAMDAANNGNTASTSTDNTVTFANAAPTIAVAAGGMCGAFWWHDEPHGHDADGTQCPDSQRQFIQHQCGAQWQYCVRWQWVQSHCHDHCCACSRLSARQLLPSP